MSDSKRKSKGKKEAKNQDAKSRAPVAQTVSEAAAPASKSLMEKTSEKVTDAVAPLKAVAGQISEAATRPIEQIRQTAHESFTQGRGKAQEFSRGVEKSVQDRPLLAILIAGGIGLLLGIIFSGDGNRHERC